jgi:aminoglycoside phosphotransferase family enzyme/predicted kinase
VSDPACDRRPGQAIGAAEAAAPGLKDDLLRPDAFLPLASSKAVAFVETHVSWVYLLDRDVFKVKKPVDLGFLDFRTKEQRRAACEAEVTLNRRLAPDVYHGVVPLRLGDDGRVGVAGNGPIVDHAVHMVRLPEDGRLDVLLRTDRLDGDTVDAVAKTIATFHADCRSDATTARFGTPSAIGENLEENFAQTRTTLEDFLSAEQAEELVRWQRSFLRGHSQVFARRAAGGYVRDGHGDLRMEHIYVEGGRTTIIDCVEFNDRFRFADVCADVAFLSMDLACAGRVDLAERLLAVYARETNDFDIYALVDFYESYRAFVRGKIASFVAQDGAVDLAARQCASREARRYFLLAVAAERRPMLLPALVAVGGVIASGKSTVALQIGAEMGAPVVDADRTRKDMLGVLPTQRLDQPAWSGAYDPSFSETVYAEVLRRASVVLASGRPVVVDASFRSAAARQAARELAIAHNVPFRFVECQAPLDVCRTRLESRQRQAGVVSDGRLAIFDEFCARFQPVTELLPDEHCVVDTTCDASATWRSRLDVWPPGLSG